MITRRRALLCVGAVLATVGASGNTRAQDVGGRRWQADKAAALEAEGARYGRLSLLDSAAHALTGAIKIRQALGDRDGERIGRMRLAAVVEPLWRDSAATLYQTASELSHQLRDANAEANALVALAAVRPSSATELLGRARTLYRRAGNGVGEARTILQVRGRLVSDSVLPLVERAVRLARTAHDSATELEALIGLAEAQRGYSEKAPVFAAYKAALGIAQATGDTTAEHRVLRALAEANMDFGHGLSGLDVSDSARALVREALAAYRRLGDRPKEAEAAMAVADSYHGMVKPDSALIYLRVALRTYREIGDVAGELDALNRIVSIFEVDGRPDSVASYDWRALRLARRSGDLRAAASTLRELGDLTLERARPDSALLFYREADALISASHGGVSEDDAIDTRYRIGAAHALLGQMASASSELREVRRRCDAVNACKTTFKSQAITDAIALLYLQTGRADSARRELSDLYRRCCGAGLATVQQRSMGTAAAAAVGHLGLAFQALGAPDSAVVYYARALDILSRESARGSRPRDMRAARWYAELARVYRRGNASELSKAVAYYDSAAAAAGESWRGFGDLPTIASDTATQDLFDEWALAWLARGAHADVKGAEIAALAATERGAQHVLRRIRAQGPWTSWNALTGRVFSTPFGSDAPTAAWLASDRPWLSRPTPTIVYRATSDTLLAWLRLPRPILGSSIPSAREWQPDVIVHRVGIRRDSVAKLVQLARDLLVHENAISGVVAIHTLSRLLFPYVFRREVLDDSELVIVPDATLATLPFALLSADLAEAPLGVRTRLRTAPSMRSMEWPRDSYGGVNAPLADTGRLQAAVLPPHGRGVGGDSTSTWATELPTNTAAEFTVLTPSSTPELLQSLVGTPIVYIAAPCRDGTFGARSLTIEIDTDRRSNSGLTFGTLWDDAPQQVDIELLVLGGCRFTGSRSGATLLEVENGLLAKGVRTLLVDLSPTPSRAPRLLLQRFLEHWRQDPDRPDRAEAMRRARGDVRRTPGLEAPTHWAGLTLVGADR